MQQRDFLCFTDKQVERGCCGNNEFHVETNLAVTFTSMDPLFPKASERVICHGGGLDDMM